MKRTRFIERDLGAAISQAKRTSTGESWRGRGVTCRREPWEAYYQWIKIPTESFFQQAILLKDEAIRLRPTFHLRLTFLSSAQFYHSECNVYLLADAILPCYSLNLTVLIIMSPRANMLPTKPYISIYSTAYISQTSLFHARHNPNRTYALYNR